MGLRRAKGGELVGKGEGGTVKHKTNVCSSPGVTREGLQAPWPNSHLCRGPHEGPRKCKQVQGRQVKKRLARGAAEHTGHGTQRGRV